MKQFDVYENPNERASKFAPYVVILSSHLGDYRALMVAPLLSDLQRPAEVVDIPIKFSGTNLTLSLLEMASVSPTHLRRRAGSIADAEDQIRRGIGRLFTGF